MAASFQAGPVTAQGTPGYNIVAAAPAGSTATLDSNNLAIRNPAPASRVDPSTITANPQSSNGAPAPYTGSDGNTYDSNNFDPSGRPLLLSSGNSKQNSDNIVNYGNSLVASINAQYGSKIQSDQDTENANIARANVLNSRSGNVGSGTGATAVATTKAKGDAVIAADQAQQSSQIGIALGKVDQLKDAQAKENDANNQRDLTNYNNLRTQNQKTATDSLSALAKGGISLDTLKTQEPQTYATLQKSLGLSDLEMAAKFNSDSSNSTKFQYKVSGDTVTAYGVDSTGKLVVHDEKVPGLSAGNYAITETKDGTILKLNKDTGEYTTLRGATKTGPISTPSKADIESALTYMRSDPGYTKAWEDQFNSDPVIQAKVIEAMKASKSKSKGTTATTANPFSEATDNSSSTA